MKRHVIGIIVASVVLFFWGFLYWGLGPYPTWIWKNAGDDVAAGDALRANFPENGTYFVPAFNPDQATMEAMYQQGPVAFVHILDADGRPSVDVTIMITGFFLNVLVLILIALLLQCVATALPTFLDQLKFVALLGLTAAILIDVGDSVWWQISLPWKLYQAFYHFSAVLIGGLILARFVCRSDARPTADSDA